MSGENKVFIMFFFLKTFGFTRHTRHQGASSIHKLKFVFEEISPSSFVSTTLLSIKCNYFPTSIVILKTNIKISVLIL